MATYDDFTRLDIRVGLVEEVHDFPEARCPAYRMLIDFGGDIGLKRTSAQITALYAKEELIGRRVVAIVNFPSKRIAGFSSEVLVLGVPDPEGRVVLLQPERPVDPGVRVY